MAIVIMAVGHVSRSKDRGYGAATATARATDSSGYNSAYEYGGYGYASDDGYGHGRRSHARQDGTMPVSMLNRRAATTNSITATKCKTLGAGASRP